MTSKTNTTKMALGMVIQYLHESKRPNGFVMLHVYFEFNAETPYTARAVDKMAEKVSNHISTKAENYCGSVAGSKLSIMESISACLFL